MKKIFILTAFTLQFSQFCSSQTDSKHNYTEAEIKKFSNYIRELENKNTSKTASEYSLAAKKQVDHLLDDHTHSFSDLEVIELAEYIKTLTKANEVAGISGEENALSKKSIANDSLNAGSNGGVREFTDYKK